MSQTPKEDFPNFIERFCKGVPPCLLIYETTVVLSDDIMIQDYCMQSTCIVFFKAKRMAIISIILMWSWNTSSVQRPWKNTCSPIGSWWVPCPKRKAPVKMKEGGCGGWLQVPCIRWLGSVHHFRWKRIIFEIRMGWAKISMWGLHNDRKHIRSEGKTRLHRITNLLQHRVSPREKESSRRDESLSNKPTDCQE